MYRLYVDLLSIRQQEREQHIRGTMTPSRQSLPVPLFTSVLVKQSGNAFLYVGRKLEHFRAHFGQYEKASYIAEK